MFFQVLTVIEIVTHLNTIGFYHPLDGVTNPYYKFLHVLKIFFLQREEGTSLKLLTRGQFVEHTAHA